MANKYGCPRPGASLARTTRRANLLVREPGGAPPMSRLCLVTAALLVATAVGPPGHRGLGRRGGGAREQGGPPGGAREPQISQRGRDRRALEQRARRSRQIEERGDRLLGAPVFVQPGVAAPYAAPQYPYPYTA